MSSISRARNVKIVRQLRRSPGALQRAAGLRGCGRHPSVGPSVSLIQFTRAESIAPCGIHPTDSVFIGCDHSQLKLAHALAPYGSLPMPAKAASATPQTDWRRLAPPRQPCDGRAFSLMANWREFALYGAKWSYICRRSQTNIGANSSPMNKPFSLMELPLTANPRH